MAVLIALGATWRAVRPFGMDTDEVRPALTGVVYALLLPALILLVLWRTPLGVDSLKISFIAACGVIAGLLVAWVVCRACSPGGAATGAILLASGFPNATYLGLPVLEQTFGEWARSIAIQYDLFACTPLVLTVGVLIAQHYGTRGPRSNPLYGLLRVPPLWAAALGIGLSLTGTPLTPWLERLLEFMGGAVVPLMLIGLGMGLRWDTWRWSQAPLLMPVLLIQLLLMPLLVYALAHELGFEDEALAAITLEGAMPSMVLGVVFADRYGLDTPLYATAVTVSTALSLLTLPVWYRLAL